MRDILEDWADRFYQLLVKSHQADVVFLKKTIGYLAVALSALLKR